MSDRDVLELAAKGAGYTDFVYDAYSMAMDRQGGPTVLWVEELAKYWNPLHDDGDAFRLQVRLDIRVCCYPGAAVAADYPYVDGVDLRRTVCEPVLDDYAAAARRAIVRAAADIGRAKP